MCFQIACCTKWFLTELILMIFLTFMNYVYWYESSEILIQWMIFHKNHSCNFAVFHELSWYANSNYLIEWRIFHKNHICNFLLFMNSLDVMLQRSRLSEVFSASNTFVISLPFMEYLDVLHQIFWFPARITFVISFSFMNYLYVPLQILWLSKRISTWITFVISLFLMNCHNVIFRFTVWVKYFPRESHLWFMFH